MHEACGVFGAVTTELWPEKQRVSDLLYTGLLALQHRGQEAAGIVTCAGDGSPFESHCGTGLVARVFDHQVMQRLKGTMGIAHTRYSTSGSVKHQVANTQPFLVHTRHGQMALAHNGQLVNASKLRQEVLQRGVGLGTDSDSELLVQLMSLLPPCGEPKGVDWTARLEHVMTHTPMAFSLGVLVDGELYGARDCHGVRPLCVGYVVDCNSPAVDGREQILAYLLASESCAIQAIDGGRLLREVAAGEIIRLTRSNGIESVSTQQERRSQLANSKTGMSPSSLCVLEYVYFCRPDTWLESQMVYSVRVQCGRQLAIECPVIRTLDGLTLDDNTTKISSSYALNSAYIVSTVPESATPSALGFAQQSGIPYMEVFAKNRYIGRTFIQPDQASREKSVRHKFGVLEANVKNKFVVIVDDSIVRGTTIRPLVSMLRSSGAAQVHIRIASPPIRYECYMGIDIPRRGELFAHKYRDEEEQARSVGADSLQYLSIEGLREAVRGRDEVAGSVKTRGHCMACLTGDYPVDLDW